MKKRVLVGLSGGVDSAVTAHLLLKQGYDVAAGFMKNFAEPENPNCHTREDRNMAIKVAHTLGIKTFLLFDFRKEYEERIINYIYEGYKKGVTPNPDVFCNNLIKFDIFLQEARTLGFDYIATGHYARKQENNGHYELLRGVDHNKDQSYFLSRLNQHQLAHALFPLGDMTKKQTREVASTINLPNASRKDSQGLCFIGKRPMKEFLQKKLPIQSGDIIDTTGKKVGTHQGAYFFTLGQSRGLDINIKAYVVAIDIENNTVIVDYNKDHPLLNHDQVELVDRHRINPENKPATLPYQLSCKIRYRQETPQPATITNIQGTTVQMQFSESQWAITPGQIIVAYQGEKVLGSGIIAQSKKYLAQNS